MKKASEELKTQEELLELLKKGLRWKRQGAKAKWSTGPSQALWDELTKLESKFRVRGDTCYCGERLPWHVQKLPLEAIEYPHFNHTCSCGRRFIWVAPGLLKHDSTTSKS